MFSGNIFVVLIILMILGYTIFWIAMIVECATKEPNQGNDKIVWILIIVFTQLIGALLYFFVRRPQRIARYGG